VALSLRPRHLARYGDIARLLVKHGRASGLRDEEQATPEDAEALVRDLESMGPTFIKLGQLLSTRADLLPPVYLEALARLQDDVEPVSFADIERIVTDELGARISKAFQTLESTPRASASLGQVHRAILRDGRSVAVKVQRPGVREKVAEDMEVIEELASFLDEHTKTGQQLGFTAMVEEFRDAITAELDYAIEADNLRTMHEVLADHDDIVVPLPVNDYSTSRVLTMDYIDGRNIASIGPLTRLEIDGERLAAALFRAYLDQILVHGFVHADPHPGNVLLTADHRLALIDLGMITRITPDMQEQLLRLLLGVSEGNGKDVAEIMAGIGEHTTDYDEAAFVRRIAGLVQRNESVAIGDIQAGMVVGELASIAADCGLRPPAELTMVSKALLNLDQVAAQLAPEFDANAVIQDHIASVMRQKMLRSASPANLASAMLDAKEFAERLPSRVNKVMDALARGELTLNVQGIDEAELMRGIQKLANRVTTGVILAALIIGGSMVMSAGHTAIGIAMLVIGCVVGAGLLFSTFRHDLPQHRRP
jgi:ubiquinone biosynthesis protein